MVNGHIWNTFWLSFTKKQSTYSTAPADTSRETVADHIWTFQNAIINRLSNQTKVLYMIMNGDYGVTAISVENGPGNPISNPASRLFHAIYHK